MVHQEKRPDKGDKLVSGIRNINKARVELKDGILAIADSGFRDITEWGQGEDGRRSFGIPGIGGWSLHAISRDDWGIWWNGVRVFRNVKAVFEYNEPHRSKVMEMREQLGTLFEAITGMFPEIGADLSPFFDAADTDMSA